jgi:hypothetical protein
MDGLFAGGSTVLRQVGVELDRVRGTTWKSWENVDLMEKTKIIFIFYIY